ANAARLPNTPQATSVRLVTDEPVYAATTFENPPLNAFAEIDPVTVGVKWYHALLLTPPKGAAQEGDGSPPSVLAAGRSTVPLNGSAPLAVASTTRYFGGGGSASRPSRTR